MSRKLWSFINLRLVHGKTDGHTQKGCTRTTDRTRILEHFREDFLAKRRGEQGVYTEDEKTQMQTIGQSQIQEMNKGRK